MKAIIPVAGVGTNLRPLTYTQPKPLIPVAGKPIISFIIDQMLDFGIDEFVFVIGYLGEKIKDYVENHYPDIKKEFVSQAERNGTGHAIWMARDSIKDVDELVIFFGDTIVEMDMKKIIHSPTSCLAVKKVEDPRNFGVVEYDSDKFVKRVVEKPKIPKSNMAMVGFYKINEVRALLEGLQYNLDNDIRTGIEFTLTDGIMHMIKNGIKFSTTHVDNWFDCGKREILLETNAILLDKEGYASQNLPQFEDSIIIHPVSIGKDCEIINSIIGPHVTISNKAKINSAIVKNSIIGNYAHIKEVVLMNSVIGNDTSITGIRQSLNIGDNTEIDFST
ncbi:MAG: sugar phosphate nucleotidyltransferase [Bacteroidetes bacterium]|jgi:glucose-1-phosphate thymidylyltransferase|nr:sugar phosphate nucleotidyltransferase [Bacteroidota bacterium]